MSLARPTCSLLLCPRDHPPTETLKNGGFAPIQKVDFDQNLPLGCLNVHLNHKYFLFRKHLKDDQWIHCSSQMTPLWRPEKQGVMIKAKHKIMITFCI